MLSMCVIEDEGVGNCHPDILYSLGLRELLVCLYFSGDTYLFITSKLFIQFYWPESGNRGSSGMPTKRQHTLVMKSVG